MTIAQGYVTITDVSDGAPTVAIIATNENHTFAASSSGAVPVLTSFVNDIIVMVGDVQATYVTVAPTVNNTYTVATSAVAPASSSTPVYTLTNVTHISGTGNVDIARMTISALNQTTTVTTSTVTVAITVRRLNQNVTFYATVTLSKAVGGSAESLQVKATRQGFAFEDSAATAPITPSGNLNTPITLLANYDGAASGNMTWKRSFDGGTFNTFTASTPHGTASSHVVTATDFGSYTYITYEVSKGTVVDRISIVRIDYGQASFLVVPEVTVGSLQLKNNTGSVTVLAKVYKGSAEIADYTGWTFIWKNNSTDITTSPPGGVSFSDFAGRPVGSKAQITVNASYVPDNGSITLNVTGTGP